MDIRGLFDNIDHSLLMKAVDKHVRKKWIKLYIKRWMVVPFVTKDGTVTERVAGTPQGGVISPLLANLFMHYACDEWMRKNYPHCPFERYADDTIVHCKTKMQAEYILTRINVRMEQCKLTLHPQKTKIVYCKDKDRTETHDITEFDFLGYTFKGRVIRDRTGRIQKNFLPAVSKKACQSLKDKIKALELHKKSGSKIEMIAEELTLWFETG